MKYFAVLLFIIFYYNTSFAQQGNVSISFNNGINFSNLVIKNTTYTPKNIHLKYTYRYGIGLKYELLKKFSIKTECNIEEKGWTPDPLLSYNPQLFDADYTFYSLPLLLEYQLITKKANFALEVGHLINVKRGNLSAREDIDYGLLCGLVVEKNIHKKINLAIIGRYTPSYTHISSFGDFAKFSHSNYAILLEVAYIIHNKVQK